jgi:Secretion system C-terminal sorting domain
MRFTFCFCLIAFRLLSFAQQIPNFSFENWSDGNPVGWSTENYADSTQAVRSTNAYLGNYAVQINTTPFTQGGVASAIYTKPYAQLTTTPTTLHGWYIFYRVDTSTVFTIDADIYGHSSILEDSVSFNGGFGYPATSIYKEFVTPITYASQPFNADSALIMLSISDTNHNSSVGSYVIVDDLFWGYETTNIESILPENNLEQCIPNPASSKTNLFYCLNINSLVNLSLYDLMGCKLKTIINDIKQSAGRYKITIDLMDLANGVYICSLNINSQQYSKKIIIQR